MRKLTFKEREALKSVAVDSDLYERIKSKLEEEPVTTTFSVQPQNWSEELGSFVIDI